MTNPAKSLDDLPETDAFSVRRAAGEPPLLELEDVHMHIVADGGERVVRAVNGVSFPLVRGRVLGIVGESGSGKSLTSMTILRLLPPGGQVIGGRIMFDGENLLDKSEAEMRRLRGKCISMIMQDPMVSLDPLFTIGHQLGEPLRAHEGLKGRALRARQIELLRAVGIPDPEARLRQYPHQLSGGMLQRVAGAIAISCDPEFLIADEATTALDATVQARFLDMLEEMQQTRNLTMMIVTHDFGVAARMCDDVIVMYAGRIVERAPVAEIFDDPRHPYTRAMLACRPHRETAEGRLASIEGQPPDPADLPRGCAFAERCPLASAECRIDPPEVAIGPEHTARCWRAETP